VEGRSAEEVEAVVEQVAGQISQIKAAT
jgi:hypothetical protein